MVPVHLGAMEPLGVGHPARQLRVVETVALVDGRRVVDRSHARDDSRVLRCWLDPSVPVLEFPGSASRWSFDARGALGSPQGMDARRPIAPLAAAMMMLLLAPAAHADTVANVGMEYDPCRQHFGPQDGVLRPPDDRYGDVVVLCTAETMFESGDIKLLEAKLPRGYHLVEDPSTQDVVWGFHHPVTRVHHEPIKYTNGTRTLRARLYNLFRLPILRLRLFVLGVRDGTDSRAPFAPAIGFDDQAWDLEDWVHDPSLQGGDDAIDLAEKWRVIPGHVSGVWYIRQGDGPWAVCAPSPDMIAWHHRPAEYIGPCDLSRYNNPD